MIFELAAQCGWSQDRLKPAPSKSLLKLFGGTLGIEEFRRVCGNVDIDITLQSFPFVANPAFIVSQKLNGVDSGPIIPGTVHGAIPFPTQTQIADKMRARVEPPRTDALFDEFVKGMEVVDEDEMP
jgi:hypothetical protein